jgi:hypothetical protein
MRKYFLFTLLMALLGVAQTVPVKAQTANPAFVSVWVVPSGYTSISYLGIGSGYSISWISSSGGSGSLTGNGTIVINRLATQAFNGNSIAQLNYQYTDSFAGNTRNKLLSHCGNKQRQ